MSELHTLGPPSVSGNGGKGNRMDTLVYWVIYICILPDGRSGAAGRDAG